MPPSVQAEKRKIAVRLWKQGNLIKDVAEMVGISANAVSGWIKRYQVGGPSALRARKRGVRTGTMRHLSDKQENMIRKLMMDKAPDQLKLDYALWTRQAVRELIELKTGLNMPIRTVGE